MTKNQAMMIAKKTASREAELLVYSQLVEALDAEEAFEPEPELPSETVKFTSTEIIEAMRPAIAQRLSESGARFGEYNVVLTHWVTRDVPYTGALPLPPGLRGMEVDVEFTIERAKTGPGT